MTRAAAAPIAIAASAGAGLVHLALGPQHLEELGPLGAGFYVAAALQIGWAVALLAALRFRDSGAGERMRAFAWTGVVINIVILGAWLISRTIGLPAGDMPWVPERIGRVDVITAMLEVAILAAIVLPAGDGRVPAHGAPLRSRRVTALAVLIIAAGTAAALAPDAPHADGHEAMAEARSAP